MAAGNFNGAYNKLKKNIIVCTSPKIYSHKNDEFKLTIINYATTYARSALQIGDQDSAKKYLNIAIDLYTKHLNSDQQRTLNANPLFINQVLYIKHNVD